MLNGTPGQPKVAIVDSNLLAALGLKAILEEAMPFMKAEYFLSLSELEANSPDNFYHYFVSAAILLKNTAFFARRKAKTIVMTLAADGTDTIPGYKTLAVNKSEKLFIKSLLELTQRAHAGGRHLPEEHSGRAAAKLSQREIEVLVLIAKGHINKEIAEKLNIGLTTAITHRKNIMAKLKTKNVSALTIYAVMHGYISVSEI